MKLSANAFIVAMVLAVLVRANTEHIQHLEEFYDESLDNNSLEGYDIHKDTISRRLSELRQEKMRCFYRLGVNDESFNTCCGPQYSKIKSSYLTQYRMLQQELEKSFNKRLKGVCSLDHSSCEDLSATLSESMKQDRDLYLEINTKKDEVESDPSINVDKLNGALDKFHRNYVAFVNARALISHSLFETINDIKDIIKKSKVQLKTNINEFDPHDIYQQLGMFKKEEIENTEHSTHDFNSGLLKEVSAKKMLNYYIANGILDKNELDMTKLPTQILAEFKDKIEKMNDKIET